MGARLLASTRGGWRLNTKVSLDFATERDNTLANLLVKCGKGPFSDCVVVG
jgi:hypothetical protein